MAGDHLCANQRLGDQTDEDHVGDLQHHRQAHLVQSGTCQEAGRLPEIQHRPRTGALPGEAPQ